MELRQHQLARTTPAVRRYIRESSQSVGELSRELGLHRDTVRKWKNRTDVYDRPHTRHNLGQSTSDLEERLIVELKQSLYLSIDDITEVMHRCINPSLSRSAVYRCLKRHHVHNLKPAKESPPAPGAFEETSIGYIHVDIKYLPTLQGKRSYAYVAIDRTTRYVYLEVLYDRSSQTAAAFIERFLDHFPVPVHTILTDNGSEFTDRFAGSPVDKQRAKPSGKHQVDKLCARHGITHKLTRPYRPQTNGMVERFNRRINEAIKNNPDRTKRTARFASHEERNAFLYQFVYNYNNTNLRVLGYKAPSKVLNDNQTEYNSYAAQHLA